MRRAVFVMKMNVTTGSLIGLLLIAAIIALSCEGGESATPTPGLTGITTKKHDGCAWLVPTFYYAGNYGMTLSSPEAARTTRNPRL